MSISGLLLEISRCNHQRVLGFLVSCASGTLNRVIILISKFVFVIFFNILYLKREKKMQQFLFFAAAEA